MQSVKHALRGNPKVVCYLFWALSSYESALNYPSWQVLNHRRPKGKTWVNNNLRIGSIRVPAHGQFVFVVEFCELVTKEISPSQLAKLVCHDYVFNIIEGFKSVVAHQNVHPFSLKLIARKWEFLREYLRYIHSRRSDSLHGNFHSPKEGYKGHFDQLQVA